MGRNGKFDGTCQTERSEFWWEIQFLRFFFFFASQVWKRILRERRTQAPAIRVPKFCGIFFPPPLKTHWSKASRWVKREVPIKFYLPRSTFLITHCHAGFLFEFIRPRMDLVIYQSASFKRVNNWVLMFPPKLPHFSKPLFWLLHFRRSHTEHKHWRAVKWSQHSCRNIKQRNWENL